MSNDIPLRDRELRLLFLLHNGCGAEDIGYSLVRTTIDHAPPYEALSYAWGEERCQITLRNGPTTTLTTNLYHALRYLQRPHASRLLWIDALCINQDNDAERSHQAQLMTQIYATAWRVLIWLGEADDDLSRCLTILNRGYQAATVQDSHSASSRSLSLSAEQKESIMQLIDRPYFNRTWVLQETMVAKTALVMWSRSTMHFETLMAACEVLDLAESCWSRFNVACQTITTIGRLRRVFQGLIADRSPLGLTQLLMHTMGKEATDPRDKVFALSGIANQGYEKAPTRPDYCRTVEEVYTKVAKFLVGDDHSLQILSAVQHAYAHSALPSWVPDWRIQYPIRLLDAAQGYLNFRVHGEHLTYPVVTQIPHPHKLALDGFSFDIVRKIDNAGLTFDIVDDCDRRLFHSPDDRCMIANTTGHDELYPRTQDDIEVAWLRTISAGLFPDGTQLETFFTRARYPQYVRWHLADKTSSAPPKEVVDEIFSFVPLWIRGRKVFVTQRGFLGLGPAETEPGDVVCILFGGNLPYVVRPLDQDEFTFLGPSYVHGIMNGEAYHEVGRAEQETFILV
jgi:hypothetical protein